MPIPKVTTSAYESADSELQELLDNLATTLKATSNWKVRKKTFIDIIEDLQLLFEVGPEVLAEQLIEGHEDEDAEEPDEETPPRRPSEEKGDDEEPFEDAFEDDDDEDLGNIERVNGTPSTDEESALPFPEMLPLYVGALLERLEETEIRSPEQAAVYILSIHREHQQAVEDWLDADRRNAKAFKKLLRADRRYAAILDMMEAHFAQSGRTPPAHEGEA